MSRRGFTTLEFAACAGFSLREVLIALVILAAGIFGLAGSTALVARQVAAGDLATERSAALQAVVEGLRATPYTSLAAGSDSVGPFHLSWSTTGLAGSTMLEVVTVGPGLTIGMGDRPHLAAEVADTFSYRIVAPSYPTGHSNLPDRPPPLRGQKWSESESLNQMFLNN